MYMVRALYCFWLTTIDFTPYPRLHHGHRKQPYHLLESVLDQSLLDCQNTCMVQKRSLRHSLSDAWFSKNCWRFDDNLGPDIINHQRMGFYVAALQTMLLSTNMLLPVLRYMPAHNVANGRYSANCKVRYSFIRVIWLLWLLITFHLSYCIIHNRGRDLKKSCDILSVSSLYSRGNKLLVRIYSIMMGYSKSKPWVRSGKTTYAICTTVTLFIDWHIIPGTCFS